MYVEWLVDVGGECECVVFCVGVCFCVVCVVGIGDECC